MSLRHAAMERADFLETPIWHSMVSETATSLLIKTIYHNSGERVLGIIRTWKGRSSPPQVLLLLQSL